MTSAQQLCERCHERPATVHFMTLVGASATMRHLCEVCAPGEAPRPTSLGLEAFARFALALPEDPAQMSPEQIAEFRRLFGQEGLARLFSGRGLAPPPDDEPGGTKPGAESSS